MIAARAKAQRFERFGLGGRACEPCLVTDPLEPHGILERAEARRELFSRRTHTIEISLPIEERR